MIHIKRKKIQEKVRIAKERERERERTGKRERLNLETFKHF